MQLNALKWVVSELDDLLCIDREERPLARFNVKLDHEDCLVL